MPKFLNEKDQYFVMYDLVLICCANDFIYPIGTPSMEIYNINCQYTLTLRVHQGVLVTYRKSDREYWQCTVFLDKTFYRVVEVNSNDIVCIVELS